MAYENTFEDVTAVLTDILDQTYQQATKTGMWTADSSLVQGFQNAKTGKIATVKVSGLANYDTNSGYPKGKAAVSFEDYVLRYDRGVSYLLDQVDVMKTANIPTASALLAEYSRSVLVPEIDAVRVSAVATSAINGNKYKSYTPAKATILTEITDALSAIENATGVDSGINILINQKYGGILKASTEVTRMKDIESSAASINNNVVSINGCPVTYVPSARMYSALDIKDGSEPGDAGFAAAEGAKDVVAIFSVPGAVQGIVAHAIQKIIPPDLNQDADATKLAFRVYHDCIVPKNKVAGTFAIVTP